MNECFYCGNTQDLIEGEYYDPSVNRDTKGLVCRDIQTCCNQFLSKRYPKDLRTDKQNEDLKAMREMRG